MEAGQPRYLGSSAPFLLPPVIFSGLIVALWSWKCLMMVLFQSKIIYMPGLPPNARRETIAEYKGQCGGIEWREEKIKSLDGTRISLLVASVNDGIPTAKTVYILYLQGNTSSLPPRLPFLSPILLSLLGRSRDLVVRYTMVCCSYRGFWNSKGRPSEKGIAMDAAASLEWIRDHFLQQGGNPTEAIPVVIWGQSVGAGIATNLSARQHLFSKYNLALDTLILETPFISVRAMLETLYPQKWLPYRHLWPFLWNHLDSYEALGVMKQSLKDAGMEAPRTLILEAGKDELVPIEHGDVLLKRCFELGLQVEKKVIGGSLHTEIIVRPEGRLVVVEAIEEVGRSSISRGHKSQQHCNSD
ncbi:uncharacterized protein L3040_007378 [Drepanopeziza brunnea f. sp. 'multigermtubi']|uniref:uncharacterized protein n=1 Tax=Drepanopeziza brunnea f. sp. 'multigermtubi' TaxID=698441 RepID=UPI0023A37830|nr:hypothetical protein L3040_007378 [Drepanopeziza brunnea f. sp. 'multigermtubi']